MLGSQVSLVGYTNAGKTSLFNALTQKKPRQNALFATLDSWWRNLYSRIGQIRGHIRHHRIYQRSSAGVIEAFTSTLLESISADVVLHVIDASDGSLWKNRRRRNPSSPGGPGGKVILVFNKVDANPAVDRENRQTYVLSPCISRPRPEKG